MILQDSFETAEWIKAYHIGAQMFSSGARNSVLYDDDGEPFIIMSDYATAYADLFMVELRKVRGIL